MTLPHDHLRHIICEAFQINDLFSSTRKNKYVIARCAFFYLMREKGYTLERLAKISCMHHTSVMNSLDRFEEYYKYYYEYRSSIDYIISEWASFKPKNTCNEK